MITKCPFPCIVKSPYGTCVAGRCMNSEYRSLWNGDKLDPRKMRQYQVTGEVLEKYGNNEEGEEA